MFQTVRDRVVVSTARIWRRRPLSVSVMSEARSSNPRAMDKVQAKPAIMADRRETRIRPQQPSEDAMQPPSAGPSTPNVYQLRPYQIEVIDACMSALDRGVRRMGVSSPTGSGKTVMFTHLIPRLIGEEHDKQGQILILLGAIELAHQTMRTIQAAHPWLTCQLEQGSNLASGRADVTIAMYQSLRDESRLRKFDPKRFKAVFVDEAHHAAAPTYIKLLSYFNVDVVTGRPSSSDIPNTVDKSVDPSVPRIPLIGFSATFSRNDKLSLGSVFEEIVYHREVGESLEEGWLAPIKVKRVIPHFDETAFDVSSVTGDFTTASLDSVIDVKPITEMVVQTYLELASERRSTLVFAVDIQHAEHITAEFRARGIDARTVSSRTKRTARLDLMGGFRRGDFPVLVNCEILLEGTDIPNIDCMLLVRPTGSSNLLMQMIGRGLRLWPGKDDCLVVDYVNNFDRLGGLTAVASLMGLDIESIDLPEVHSGESHVAAAGSNLRTVRGLTFEDIEDPFGISTSENPRSLSYNAWVTTSPRTFYLDTTSSGIFSIVHQDGVFLIRHGAPIPKELGLKMPTTQARVHGQEATLDQAFKAGDALVRRILPRSKLGIVRRHAPWRKEPISEKQRAWLSKYKDGRYAKEGMTKGAAAALMTALKHGGGVSITYRDKLDKVEARVAKRQQAKEKKTNKAVTVGKLK